MRRVILALAVVACGGDDGAVGLDAEVSSDEAEVGPEAEAEVANDDVEPEAEVAIDDVEPEAEVAIDDVEPEAEVAIDDVEHEAEVATDPCPVEAGLVAPGATDLDALAATEAGKVRGVWLAPADRPFAPGLHARLDAWITLAGGFVADELARWTGETKTFVPQRGEDGRWDVVFLEGLHDAAFYHAHATSPDAPGEALAEIFARLPAAFHRDAVIVYFYDTAVVSGAGLVHTGQGGSAAPWQGDHAGYALIGSHVLGVGFDTVRVDLTTQRCAFDDTTPSGLEDYDGDGAWRPLDRGEWASTFVGASIHELGHAFGLDHVFDDADEDGVENNLMGNGFRRFGGRFSERLPQPPTLLGPTSAAALVNHAFLVAAPP